MNNTNSKSEINNFSNSASHNSKFNNKKSHLTINLPQNQINMNNSLSSLNLNNAVNTINSIQDLTLKKCFSDLLSDDLEDHVINPNFTSIMSQYNDITKNHDCSCTVKVDRESLVFSPKLLSDSRNKVQNIKEKFEYSIDDKIVRSVDIKKTKIHFDEKNKYKFNFDKKVKINNYQYSISKNNNKNY